MISILIADDHGIVREGLRRLLESEPDFKVAGEASDGREVLERVVALHPDVVKRVLGLGVAKTPSQLKARMIDPYREFIDDTLRRYPKLLATRLYDMVRERGFTGGVRTLREHVALVRNPN